MHGFVKIRASDKIFEFGRAGANMKAIREGFGAIFSPVCDLSQRSMHVLNVSIILFNLNKTKNKSIQISSMEWAPQSAVAFVE